MDTIKALDYQATLDLLDQTNSDIVSHNSGNINFLLSENGTGSVLKNEYDNMNEVDKVYTHNLSLINAILTQLQTALTVANKFTQILTDCSDPSQVTSDIVARFMNIFALFVRTCTFSTFDNLQTIWLGQIKSAGETKSCVNPAANITNKVFDGVAPTDHVTPICLAVYSGTVIKNIYYSPELSFKIGDKWNTGTGQLHDQLKPIENNAESLKRNIGYSFAVISSINQKMDEVKKLRTLYITLKDNLTLSMIRVNNQLKLESEKILVALKAKKNLLTCQKYELQKAIMPDNVFDDTDFV